MIDVLNKIKPFLQFDSEDIFYHLLILQRKKDNPELNQSVKIIKIYYISNIEYLDTKYDEIKKLCQIFNARAMINLNKKSFRKTAFKCMVNIANTISNEEYKTVKSAYNRATTESDLNNKDKKWIVDLDGEDIKYDQQIQECINQCRPNPGSDKILISLPTKNGIHLITRPFDVAQFNKLMFIDYKLNWSDIMNLHKNNLINLYIP